MTIDSLNEKELLIALETELYRRSYYEYFKAACYVLEPSTEFEWNWHIKHVADILQGELERLVSGEDKEKDYCFNLPFRSSKSLLISIVFPSWVLLRDPTLSIGCISATQDLATKFSHKTKMLIESGWYQERFGNVVQIRADSKGKADFMTSNGGRVSAFGIHTAKIVGTGFDFLILDDPQSTATVTQVGLENTINSYRDAVHSRIKSPKKSVRILSQQRVHSNDLSGWVMRVMPDKFYNLIIPAILSSDLSPKELAVNYKNNLFWESRFSQKVLDDFKLTMRPNMFSGQLQQRPQAEEGGLIRRDWFTFKKLSEVLPLNLQWNLVLDTATSSKQTNDPSAFLLCAKYNNMLIIRKVQHKWVEFYELIEEIKEWKKVYNVNKIYVEDKSSGIQIVQELKRATNYNVLTLNPKSKDKTQRVMAIQPVLQSKRVILIEDDSWNEIFLSEIASFPLGVHDDIVDCLSYACTEFLLTNGITIFR